MKISKINDPNLKSTICNSVLRSLPMWFGIPKVIDDYIRDVKVMDTWAAFDDTSFVGFASVKKHFPQSAEIHVMGIFQEFHGKGVGRQLIAMLEKDLKEQNIKYLTVKTLSDSVNNEEYEKTRAFYYKMGFTPLEEFKTLWDEDNPCLILIKSL
jgi:ribosomal protein S18 acetylase RimI-like enzyme